MNETIEGVKSLLAHEQAGTVLALVIFVFCAVRLWKGANGWAGNLLLLVGSYLRRVSVR